jgi:magnesium chelatase family protein
MSMCRARSLSLFGIDALPVEVEVDVSSGLPGFSIVGLPDAAVQEARERVRVAISNSGYKFPMKCVIVNLAPANLRKEGPAFDLPIALGILAASGALAPGGLERAGVVGKLSLDGGVRGIKGALSMAEGARKEGLTRLVLPERDARGGRDRWRGRVRHADFEGGRGFPRRRHADGARRAHARKRKRRRRHGKFRRCGRAKVRQARP